MGVFQNNPVSIQAVKFISAEKRIFSDYPQWLRSIINGKLGDDNYLRIQNNHAILFKGTLGGPILSEGDYLVLEKGNIKVYSNDEFIAKYKVLPRSVIYKQRRLETF